MTLKRTKTRFVSIRLPWTEEQHQSFLRAAEEAGETPAEFILGGAVMLMGERQRALESFMAGLPLEPVQVRQLSRNPALQKSATDELKVLRGLQSGLIQARG